MLAACSGCQANSIEWRDFSESEGKFSVVMPGTPERATYEMPITSGTMKFVSHAVDLPNEAKYFMVTYVDYPPGTTGDDVLAHQVMDRYVAGGARKKNLKVEQKSKIKLGEHPGQEYLFREPEYGDKSLWRVYLVGNRLYQLVANWDPETAGASVEAEKFLNSFRLTE